MCGWFCSKHGDLKCVCLLFCAEFLPCSSRFPRVADLDPDSSLLEYIAVSAEVARAAGSPKLTAAVLAGAPKREREYDEAVPAKKKPCIKPSGAKEAAGSVSKEAAGVLAEEAIDSSAAINKAPEALHEGAAGSRAVS